MVCTSCMRFEHLLSERQQGQKFDKTVAQDNEHLKLNKLSIRLYKYIEK